MKKREYAKMLAAIASGSAIIIAGTAVLWKKTTLPIEEVIVDALMIYAGLMMAAEMMMLFKELRREKRRKIILQQRQRRAEEERNRLIRRYGASAVGAKVPGTDLYEIDMEKQKLWQIDLKEFHEFLSDQGRSLNGKRAG
ncbi:MAG: hypothetical protein Q4B01_03960 [Eubacteriales bacterium]|nr:hypothetical protein [Eubacteriales bacterium]